MVDDSPGDVMTMDLFDLSLSSQVMLLQLREETQPLASGLALLLLRSYLFSIIPIALWITLFMKVSKLAV